MSRTRRFLGGIALGHMHLALVTVVGLWMTPFLLHHLGEGSLGLWLIAQQLLGYLLLLDIGVSALLPRETAFATGRAGGVTMARDLPNVVARARRAVMWQAPVVGVAALIVWAWMPEAWRPAAGPLACLLASFVLLFPARLYPAFLQGVQELAFLGRVQMASWAIATGVTIGLVLYGASLHALVAGWAAGQLFTAAAARLRIARLYAGAWPSWSAKATLSDVKSYMSQAGWISVAQVSQVLLTGSDLLLVGTILGAGAVVQYACTTKLATVLSNHPQLIMQAATPALSELRAANQRERLLDASVALMLAMLTVSGLVACLILALNAAFVHWWVGPAQYGGHLLTLLAAIHLIARHLNVTFIYGLFCFGQERRISVTNLADGALSITAAIVLVPLVGPVGAVLGSLIAVMLVSVPSNIFALARETGTTSAVWVGHLRPWLWRFVALGVASALVPSIWAPTGVMSLVGAGTVVTTVYALVMLQGLSGGPLGAYVRPRLAGLMAAGWKPGLSERT